jgi:hypothetical protein
MLPAVGTSFTAQVSDHQTTKIRSERPAAHRYFARRTGSLPSQPTEAWYISV